MTVLTALARVAAAAEGRARPTKTVRHVHLSGCPLVVVAPPLPRGGDDREKPPLLAVYEPRDRTQRFEFAAALAAIVLPYIDGYAADAGRAGHGDTDQGHSAHPYPAAPQI